jgi:hypothetical protein
MPASVPAKAVNRANNAAAPSQIQPGRRGLLGWDADQARSPRQTGAGGTPYCLFAMAAADDDRVAPDLKPGGEGQADAAGGTGMKMVFPQMFMPSL